MYKKPFPHPFWMLLRGKSIGGIYMNLYGFGLKVREMSAWDNWHFGVILQGHAVLHGVARFGLFEGKKLQIWPILISVGLDIF